MHQAALLYIAGMADTTTARPELAIQRFKALGDGMRLRILSQLAGGEHCVCDLMDALDAGQSLLSFHLRTLKDAGLVTDRRAGRWVHYSINAEALAEMEELLGMLRESAATAVGPGEARCE
jgi:ArsR family transcriptional regulator, arsenate/arsenite/antimonite-responsive transcriptional repressor